MTGLSYDLSGQPYNSGVSRPLDVVLVGLIARLGRGILASAVQTPVTLREYPCDLAEAEVLIGQPITPRMLGQAPKLRLVHAAGAGWDAIATWELRPGIPVCNVYHHEHAIAEYVIMAMLALERDLRGQHERTRRGDWTGSAVGSAPRARELGGLTLGILGFGHIGKEAARLAEVFGMHVRALRSGHSRAEFEELLRIADHLLLACPLTDATRNLIGEPELRMMKPDAFLINVARGEIVQEEALYRALKERWIRGAALDVWYRYPKPDEPNRLPFTAPFGELDNVILSPHSSGWTSRTLELRMRDIAANLDRLARGEPLARVVFEKES